MIRDKFSIKKKDEGEGPNSYDVYTFCEGERDKKKIGGFYAERVSQHYVVFLYLKEKGNDLVQSVLHGSFKDVNKELVCFSKKLGNLVTSSEGRKDIIKRVKKEGLLKTHPSSLEDFFNK